MIIFLIHSVNLEGEEKQILFLLSSGNSRGESVVPSLGEHVDF